MENNRSLLKMSSVEITPKLSVRIPTVGEILEAAGEQLAPVACLLSDTEPCKREDACQTISMWKKFNRLSHDFFYGIKLTDLVE